MEDATISKQSQQQQLYQRGKYPSVVDTDDLVFEMGVQLVGNLNKEKLLDGLVKKNRLLEKTVSDTVETKTEAEKKLILLEESNRLYVENNQRLDAELVKVRNELETIKPDCTASKKELEATKVAYQTSVKQYEEKIAEIEIVHKKELINLTAIKDKEIADIKKRKTSKKRGG